MPYLAQHVRLSDVEVEDGLLCALSLVNRNTSVPVTTGGEGVRKRVHGCICIS